MHHRKKILFVSCSTGLGHVRAAEALYATCREKYPEVEARHIDIANYSGWFLRLTLINFYYFLARHFPQLYKKIYDYSDTLTENKLFKLTLFLFRTSSRKLFRFINDFAPSSVVCTHYLFPKLLPSVPPAFTTDLVITDYQLNLVWLSKNLRDIFVANEEMKQALDSLHPSVITSGLPVHPNFFKEKNINDLAKKYNLNTSRPTILLLSGGAGLVDTSIVAKNILTRLSPLNLIAVAGKNNHRLYKKLTDCSKLNGSNIFLTLHFTEKMDEWMRLADVVITKPGGLSITECLYLKKPMILINPVPGQEEANAEYLVKHNYGRLAGTAEEAVKILTDLLNKTIHLAVLPLNNTTPNEQILQTVMADPVTIAP